MGLFLGLSGIVGDSNDEVAAALRDFALTRGGYLRPSTAEEGEDTLLVIGRGSTGSTVFYPEAFLGWEEASEFLSTRLRKPTFSFHIHDGDLWMFHLYSEGRVVTAFNPMPEYWGDLSREESELMSGSPKTVAEYVPGVSVKSIERYFVRWDSDSDAQEKAYPDDEFARGVDWQLVDFMKKVGFIYPFDSSGRPTGKCYAFRADTKNA